MDYGIYFASDASCMSQEDVLTMIKYYIKNGEYEGWSLDDITGGETEFINPEEYNKVKIIFQMLNE